MQENPFKEKQQNKWKNARMNVQETNLDKKSKNKQKIGYKIGKSYIRNTNGN
jgi:hypothetical protein